MASNSSSPAPAHLHDNLMELYTNGAGLQRKHPSANNSSQNSQHSHVSNTQRRRSLNTNASISSTSLSINSSDSKKKKRSNRRRFLPMVSSKRSGNSSSEDSSDEEYDRRKEEWRRRSSNGEGGQSVISLNDGLKDAADTSLIDHDQSAAGADNQSSNRPLHLNDTYQFQSALGQRISKEYHNQLSNILNNQSTQKQFILDKSQLPPPEFLRLPPTLVKLKHGWVDIQLLEEKIIQCHLDHTNFSTGESPLMHDEDQTTSRISCITRVVQGRDPNVGLGMSLRECNGCIYVQAVLRRDGTRIDDCNNNVKNGGPAYLAGLRPGDRLLGLNGLPFLKGRLACRVYEEATLPMEASPDDILKSVGDAISRASMPMVVHYHRDRSGAVLSLIEQDRMIVQPRQNMAVANQHAKQTQRSPPRQNGNHVKISPPIGPYIHPFAKALSKQSIIQPGHEEQVITQQIRVLCDRTRQWKSKLSYRLRASDFKLRPQLDPRDVEPTYYASFFTDDGDAPPFFSYKYAKSVRSYAPSTPMIQDWRLTRDNAEATSPVRPPSRRMSREDAVLADLYAGLDQDDADVQDLFLGRRVSSTGDTVRQGGGGVAYPSPRYFASNERERASDVIVPLVGVRKAICVRILNTFLDNKNRAAFSIWCYDVESGMEWWAPVRYHEDFKDLRSALIRIDKNLADIPFPNMKWGFGIAMTDAKESASNRELRRDQLECFLRRVFAEVYRGPLHPHLAEVAIHLQTFVGCDGVLTDDDSSLALNRQVAISETTYGKRSSNSQSEPDNTARKHLKRSVQRYVYRLFLLPSIESLVSHFVDDTKQKMFISADQTSGHGSQSVPSDSVEKIRDFIDRVQELILEGCHDDLTSITQRRDFAAINDFSSIDDLLREAVREQVEIEVYVPLRTTISKYLVCAFYNEDVEMKHKMKALENKPQSFFRIHLEHRSRSDWKSVSTILQEGVGRSTLPSVKLRAIVDAAKEVTQLHSEERGCFEEASFFDGPIKSKTLGADDFLPIFIFCFVQAKLERPCALCELLQTMCDPFKLNGETGYYLASFHAAMTHINELDLTEANDELSIFLDLLPD